MSRFYVLTTDKPAIFLPSAIHTHILTSSSISVGLLSDFLFVNIDADHIEINICKFHLMLTLSRWSTSQLELPDVVVLEVDSVGEKDED